MSRVFLHPSTDMKVRRPVDRRCQLCGCGLTSLGLHADTGHFDCGFREDDQ